MLISIATATYFFRPFEETLEIIAEAGFQNIELDLYWERKDWAMAQHLKGCNAQETIRQIRQAGLKVTSIHDGGGVLEEPHSAYGYVNPQLAEILDQLDEAPGCIVFHTPHIEGSQDAGWWKTVSGEIVKALEPYRSGCPALTIENIPYLDGYTVPLVTPEALLDFVTEHDLGVTLDTTHYAQMGIDILEAAQILNGKLKTVHLSDYVDGTRHIFPGEGKLNLEGFFKVLPVSSLHSINLECSAVFPGENATELGTPALISRLKTARDRLERLLCTISA
jgi:sugar phosphate isomerase/epimerase